MQRDTAYRHGPAAAPAITAAEIARARARLPHAFRRPPLQRLARLCFWLAFTALFAWCLHDFDASPERLWNGLQRLGRVLSFMFPPHIWTSWREMSEILTGLAQTLSMAFLGTVLGAVIAFPLSFLGAQNINRLPFLRFGVRRGFDIIRAFETLILALIFIRAFGLGPMAGVLAIAFSDVGSFAKLFAEAIENVSRREVEGVVASGASESQAVRFGIMPQVLPVILSIVLYNFESNVRFSTILGIVGAGGIGYILSNRIQVYKWDEVWSIIFLVVIMVYLIDWISAAIRARIIGKA